MTFTIDPSNNTEWTQFTQAITELGGRLHGKEKIKMLIRTIQTDNVMTSQEIASILDSNQDGVVTLTDLDVSPSEQHGAPFACATFDYDTSDPYSYAMQKQYCVAPLQEGFRALAALFRKKDDSILNYVDGVESFSFERKTQRANDPADFSNNAPLLLQGLEEFCDSVSQNSQGALSSAEVCADETSYDGCRRVLSGSYTREQQLAECSK